MNKFLKISLWTAGVFIGLLLVVVVGFKLFFPAEKVKAMAIEKGSELLEREISIEKLDLSIWGGLGLKLVEVQISTPENFDETNFLTAENIDLKLQILPLFSGEFRIDRLIINQPIISMHKNKNGFNNYTFKKAEEKAPPGIAEKLTPETKAASVALSFDNFEIENGTINYRDDSLDLSMQIMGLNLSTSLANNKPGIFESKGEVSIDSLVVKSKTDLPVFKVDLKYLANYDMNVGLLELSEARLDLNGMKLKIKANVSHAKNNFYVKGNLKSDNVMIDDLLNFIPAKKLDVIKDYKFDGGLAIDVDYEYVPDGEQVLSYNGTVILGNIILTQKDIEGVLKFERALIDFKPDNLRLNIEKGTFDGKPLRGHLVIDDFKNPTINANLAGSLNLSFITPFLPDDFRGDISGIADFDLKISGKTKKLRDMDYSGKLKITDGYYSSGLLPEPLEEFTIDTYIDKKVAKIENLSGKMSSGSFNFNGRITKLIPYLISDSLEENPIYPEIDGDFNSELDFSYLTKYLPPKGDPQLKGEMSIRLKLAGSMEEPERIISQGEVIIKNGSYNDNLLPEPIELFESSLSIAPDTITVKKMTVKFTSSDISFTGKLANPFPYLLPLENIDRSRAKKPLFLFELKSNYFDTDKLFPEATPGAGTERANIPEDSISIVILPDIDGRGTMSIDTLIYAQVELANVKGNVKIADRIIEVYNVSGDVYTGKVSGNTTIDLNDFNKPHYVGKFRASQIEADDFVSRFSKFGGHIFGKVDLNGSYDAFGWEPEEFLNSLSMNSTADMKKGKIVTTGFAYSAINSMANQVGEPFDKEQEVRNMWTNIQVNDGKVKLDQLKTSFGKLGVISIDGYYSFSGELDYKGSLLLSKEWTKKLLSKGGLLGDLSGFLNDKSVDQIKLPLLIGGTVDKPKMNIDISAISKEAGKSIEKEAKNLLKGLF